MQHQICIQQGDIRSDPSNLHRSLSLKFFTTGGILFTRTLFKCQLRSKIQGPLASLYLCYPSLFLFISICCFCFGGATMQPHKGSVDVVLGVTLQKERLKEVR